jgi:hypothetical protein
LTVKALHYQKYGSRPVDVLSIVLGVGTALGGGGTLFLYMEARGSRARKRREIEMAAWLAASINPIQADLQMIHAKLDNDSSHLTNEIKVAIHEALDPVKSDLSTLNTKIEPLWKSLEALAVANAQMIHKPHPDHKPVDDLLDAYMAFVRGDGPFSPDQELQLRAYLTLIKDWKPGDDAGFPVAQGDPTRAAILLSTMELTRIRRRQEHQEHQ